MQNTEKITKLLLELGLSDKEVRVYISLLKLGSATVSQISHESGIARTYVYDIAEDLQKKGFLGVLEQRGIRNYESLNHAELVAFIKRKNEELTTLGKKVSEAVSDFESLRQNKRLPTKVEFFSGTDGVLNIYDQVRSDIKKMRKPFEVVTVFSPDKLEATFPGWFENKKFIDGPKFMSKRYIVHESNIFRGHVKQRNEGTAQYSFKIWPLEKGEFPVDTLCWGNKIAFIELAEYPTGTIIENEALVKTFKMWFENMWGNL